MEVPTVGQVRMRPMKEADGEAVLRIYAQGIATGDATFEAAAPPWEEWDRTHLPHSRIVAEMDSLVVGWAALSPVSDRCVYGGVAEVSVYVASGARGKGIGLALLDALVRSSEAEGIWTLQAGLFPENVASVRIHERVGFRAVGVRERLGQLAGVWRDVLLMERRSQVQGR
jgi:phosphinothricin acetyltransferase